MIGGQLQKAIFAVLTATPAVAGGRVYDNPPSPDARVFPDVTLGTEQVVEDGDSCGDGWEVYFDVHVWSRSKSGSKLEAKNIAADIAERMKAPLWLPAFTVIEQKAEGCRTLDDPDGITRHAVLTFKFIIDPA